MATPLTNPITESRAEKIRGRFLDQAAATRESATTLTGADQDRMLALADSQERMGHKRYEAMTVRAI